MLYYLVLSCRYETKVSEPNDGRKFLGLIGFNIILSPLFIIISERNK